MDQFNKFIEKHLNLNIEIDNSFFKQTVFKDKNLETLYKNHFLATSKLQILLSEMMLLLGYFASLIYVFFAYYKLIFLILILSFLSLSIILMIITHNVDNQRIKFLINHFQIFLLCLSLNLKANIISIIYNNELDDNYGELLRVIIYDFVSTNLFILVRHEGNIGINIFYFLINFNTIIIAHIKSNKNHFYFLEGITSFFLSSIFYCFRKAWDYRMRSLFAEKYKTDKFYIYTIDFINGLNAHHSNYKNKKLIYMNEKLKRFFDQINKIKNFTEENNIIIDKSNDEKIINKELNSEKKSDDNVFSSRKNVNDRKIDQNNNNNQKVTIISEIKNSKTILNFPKLEEKNKENNKIQYESIDKSNERAHINSFNEDSPIKKILTLTKKGNKNENNNHSNNEFLNKSNLVEKNSSDDISKYTDYYNKFISNLFKYDLFSFKNISVDGSNKNEFGKIFLKGNLL